MWSHRSLVWSVATPTLRVVAPELSEGRGGTDAVLTLVRRGGAVLPGPSETTRCGRAERPCRLPGPRVAWTRAYGRKYLFLIAFIDTDVTWRAWQQQRIMPPLYDNVERSSCRGPLAWGRTNRGRPGGDRLHLACRARHARVFWNCVTDLKMYILFYEHFFAIFCN